MEQKKNTLSDQQPPSYLSKRNELNVEAMILFSPSFSQFFPLHK